VTKISDINVSTHSEYAGLPSYYGGGEIRSILFARERLFDKENVEGLDFDSSAIPTPFADIGLTIFLMLAANPTMLAGNLETV
jgi:hypothetical protein